MNGWGRCGERIELSHLARQLVADLVRTFEVAVANQAAWDEAWVRDLIVTILECRPEGLWRTRFDELPDHERAFVAAIVLRYAEELAS